VTNRLADIERFAEGIRYRSHGLDIGRLKLLENGHMTYAQFLGEAFYWRQSPEEWERQPRLWPLAVIEYPLSFLTLYRAICDLCRLGGPFHLRLEYRNVAHHTLPAGVPTPFGFLDPRPQPFGGHHLHLAETVPTDFLPNPATFDLIRRIYAAFGHATDAIPFWDRAGQRFDLPPG
jgi:hypothetical protein